MLAAALAYVDAGWPVFPVNGKVPLVKRGLHDATTDRATVERWWNRVWPGANVAVRTGAESGLLVLDVDPEHGGGESLARLLLEHEGARSAEVFRTVQALTGGGGVHYFFTCSEPVRNSAGKLGPGLDIRGDAGYVVAPPSVHASGEPYEWRTAPDELPLAPAPAWLLKRLRDERRNGAAPHTTAPGEPIPEGRRNDTIFRLVCAMRRQGADEETILAAARTRNERASVPLTDEEVRRIAASGARYEPSGEGPALTDLGNAERLATRYAGSLRYVRERRHWLHWHEGRWREDRSGAADRAAKDIARALLVEAAAADGEQAKALARWALTSQSEPRIRAQLALAGTEPGVVLAADELDADPCLLACADRERPRSETAIGKLLTRLAPNLRRHGDMDGTQ